VARIAIADGRLPINVEGLDKLLALKSRLDIPREHVTGVAHGSVQASCRPRGLRLPGSFISGAITAASSWKPGHGETDGWSFWDVHNPEQAIVITTGHEHDRQIVMGVDEPAATVRAIECALAARPSESQPDRGG